MKNKLYILLAPFYFAMTAFVLYINGVFTGEIASLSNLIINGLFLFVIGILFICSFISFHRLNQITDALQSAADQMADSYRLDSRNLWEKYKDRKDVFLLSSLNRQFEKYQAKVASHTTRHGAVTKDCSIEDYYNEGLLEQAGSVHFNSAIPGTLTGLGILGTFLGLSIGLSSFTGTDIFTISDNIAPLLEGMKVAFHTSVYGIFFSLIFTFVYRSLMADAYGKLSYFQETFQECVAPIVTNQDENMTSMLVYQTSMTNTLKSILELMKGQAAEQTRGVERIVEQFQNQMAASLDSEFRSLGQTMRQASVSQQLYADNFGKLEESTRNLMETAQSLSIALKQSLEREERMEHQLKSSCNQLANELYVLQQVRESYEK